MGTNECSQPASKSSWDSQDFGDVNMVLKMVHFHKSSRPQWVNHMMIDTHRKFTCWPHVGPMNLAIWEYFRWQAGSALYMPNILRNDEKLFLYFHHWIFASNLDTAMALVFEIFRHSTFVKVK